MRARPSLRTFFGLFFLCAATLSPIAQASGEGARMDDFARHWPVETDETGLFTVTLTPALYGQVQRADLRDVAAFNGAGEAMAFEPMSTVWKPPEPEWRTAHAFALPEGSEAGDGGLSLEVEKGADGRIRLRAATEGAGAASATEAGGDLLIDTGVEPEENLRLRALAFDFDGAAVELSAQVRIDASDDLESWRTVARSAGLLRLQQGERLLERKKIELGAIGERYLRVSRLDARTPLPLDGVRVETIDAEAPDPRPVEELEVEPAGRDGEAVIYRLPARIAAEHVDLRLGEENTVAVARISSREDDGDRWRFRGTLTAFRLRAEGVELDNEPLDAGGSRDRQWRVELESGRKETAPVLVFSYRPERWLLLTKGEAPYVIAAGSRRAVREHLPLRALMAPIRAKYGEGWQPPEVELGEPVIAAGDAALEESFEERFSGQLLWALLIGSALAIAFMVFRLMREPGDRVA